MPRSASRFVEVVTLSLAAHRDLCGSRERFFLVERYLAERRIRVTSIFRLGGLEYLLVLEAPESPTRILNRALAQAWPDSGDRPGLARMVNAAPWIQRASEPQCVAR